MVSNGNQVENSIKFFFSVQVFNRYGVCFIVVCGFLCVNIFLSTMLVLFICLYCVTELLFHASF